MTGGLPFGRKYQYDFIFESDDAFDGFGGATRESSPYGIGTWTTFNNNGTCTIELLMVPH